MTELLHKNIIDINDLTLQGNPIIYFMGFQGFKGDVFKAISVYRTTK